MPQPPTIALFFATSGHSGVDRAMQYLVPAMAKRGYNVDLLRVRKHGPWLQEAHPRVREIELGAAHVYSSLPALVRYLRRARPAVCLSDKDRVNRTALVARAIARVPTKFYVSTGTTVSVDLADRGPVERTLQTLSMRYLYPRAAGVIVTSKGVADDMADYSGLERAHIKVVPSPVIPEQLFDIAPSPPDHPWFREHDVPVVLGVGELNDRKDYETLVRAFARAREQRAMRLVILGEGKRRQHLLDLARRLGVDQDFALPGFVDDPYAYMAAADVFVHTSRLEGLGFVIIEALALGTPVAVTDCPSGPREILADGRYGPLVPMGDTDAIAAGIIAVLADPLPRATLQQAARPYEIEHSTDAYLTALGLATRVS